MARPGRVALLVGSLLVVACGHSGSSVPAADRARASQIAAASDLIGGPKASGQVGDFLLANTKVRFVIAGAGRTRTWIPVGGQVIDADRVRDGAGDDRFQEMSTRLGELRVLWAETVEVANDGTNGKSAVVRVTGHDIAIPYLQSILPLPAGNVTAVTEYRLDPYAESLEMTTTVTDHSGRARSLPVGDVLITGDFESLYAPGYGTDRSSFGSASNVRYVAAFGGSVSYAYTAAGRQLTMLAPQAEIMGIETDSLSLPANGAATFTRYLAVGTGDVTSLLPEIVRREGQDPALLGTVQGTVTATPSATPVAGARVELSTAAGTYAIAVAGADGTYRAPVEPGSYTYVASAVAHPGTASGSVAAAAGATTPQDLQLADAGGFAVQIDDAAGGPCPARLALAAVDGSYSAQYLSADGRGTGVLPPGDYQAVVSRGYEWDAQVVPFTVTAAETTTIAATLTRVVDTSGFIALDSHTHTAISVDSQLDPRIRVAHALADGVELVVTTDHDVLFDLAPVMADLGLQGTFATVVGTEISPMPGHINGYPLVGGTSADTDGYWPVKFWSEDASHEFVEALWPQAIFAGLRDKLGAQVVQINHPRSGQGLMNWIDYDPALGLPSVPADQFDMSWDVFEICNAGCDDQSGNYDALKDYYSFLNQGYMRAAVGVSDNHGWGNFLGRARTMVQVPDDDPRTLVTDDVWTALKAGQAVVLDGPFVVASITDDDGAPVGMGGLAKVTGATLTLHATVQAPPWISTDVVRVIANGTEVKSVTISAAGSPAPVVRFDADIGVPAPAKDTWYVIIVDGNTAMTPVIGAKPRSITNPIFVDRDGNGVFDAPGL